MWNSMKRSIHIFFVLTFWISADKLVIPFSDRVWWKKPNKNNTASQFKLFYECQEGRRMEREWKNKSNR